MYSVPKRLLTKEGNIDFKACSPVRHHFKFLNKSRMIHVMCCFNIGGPPSKSKKVLMIDSEEVP